MFVTDLKDVLSNGQRGGTMNQTQNGRDTREGWKSSIETARGHFDQAFRELGRAAEQAKVQGKEVWQSAQEKAQQTWADVRARGLTAWEDTRGRGQEYYNSAEIYVRQNPAKAVGMAALAGIILGMVLTSGSDEE
jgi:ElaB/YqjD/DUF883 family membrane-anchored ribosome-binding protein